MRNYRSSLIAARTMWSDINYKLGRGGIYRSEPHTLAFQIGGVLISSRPARFGAQALANSVSLCTRTSSHRFAPQQLAIQLSWHAVLKS